MLFILLSLDWEREKGMKAFQHISTLWQTGTAKDLLDMKDKAHCRAKLKGDVERVPIGKQRHVFKAISLSRAIHRGEKYRGENVLTLVHTSQF